ncbi:hypothetical protein ACFLR5_01835 [Elusimicrobiota bacterium]
MRKLRNIFNISLLILSVLISTSGILSAGSATKDIEISIVPIVTTSLISSPTYYNFGNLEVATSSNSETALLLTNDGTVGIKIEKTVLSDDGWDITKSTNQIDGFNLWGQVNPTRPAIAEFTVSDTHQFSKSGIGESYYSNLTDDSGVQIDMDPGDNRNFWLRIDMPSALTESRSQKIQLRLKAIANTD